MQFLVLRFSNKSSIWGNGSAWRIIILIRSPNSLHHLDFLFSFFHLLISLYYRSKKSSVGFFDQIILSNSEICSLVSFFFCNCTSIRYFSTIFIYKKYQFVFDKNVFIFIHEIHFCSLLISLSIWISYAIKSNKKVIFKNFIMNYEHYYSFIFIVIPYFCQPICCISTTHWSHNSCYYHLLSILNIEILCDKLVFLLVLW